MTVELESLVLGISCGLASASKRLRSAEIIFPSLKVEWVIGFMKYFEKFPTSEY